MVLSLVLVNFVDGDGGVDDGGLDGLLLDDGLDVLVDVVVDVLAGNGANLSTGPLGLAYGTSVLELSCLGGETFLDVVVITVLDLTVLYTCEIVGVLFRENLAVNDWLDRGVVVVLVHFAIDSCLDVLVVGRQYCLVLDGRVDHLQRKG